MASRWLRFIFQLPAMIGLRAIRLGILAERLATGERADHASNGTRPGSVLPSRNSSDAPPPVEMCETSDAYPNFRSAAALSPPPTTEKQSLLAIAAATARVPAAKS